MGAQLQQGSTAAGVSAMTLAARLAAAQRAERFERSGKRPLAAAKRSGKRPTPAAAAAAQVNEGSALQEALWQRGRFFVRTPYLWVLNQFRQNPDEVPTRSLEKQYGSCYLHDM